MNKEIEESDSLPDNSKIPKNKERLLYKAPHVYAIMEASVSPLARQKKEPTNQRPTSAGHLFDLLVVLC